jgi:N-acetylglucosamine-6-phosphate deacetylase
MPADLVVLEPDLSVAATIVAGEAAFDPAGLLGVRS